MNAIKDPVKFRNELVSFIDKFPELFPNRIKKGFAIESDHKKQWIKESKFARYVRFKAEAPPIILQIN